MTRSLALRRTLAAGAVSPLLLAGLAACGGDDSGSTASDGGASQTATQPADTTEPGDEVDPADFGDVLTEGFTSITTAHVDVNAKAGGAGDLTGEGSVDYTGDSPMTEMTMTSDALPGDLEARLVDGVLYVQLGQLTQGKFWKVDLDAPGNPLGALGSQLDPKSSIEMLEKSLDTVTFVGEEQSLDHYRASVDPKALLEQMGPGASAGAAAMPDTIEYDVWVDDQSRLTKMSSDMGSLGTFEMELSDWGTDVQIEAPPADQVIKMPAALGSSSIEPQV